ncbi:hypothetical protein C6558_13265 [Ensifer sp. NM-2]|uniref:CGNR zinc finger domain-containing protein n=1 Tax=Ensifer sp. NM-2 TaxID=2109730 RepID=UPI000D136C0A|nr:ABATE domain-containing protein [Ensifer sp. NM-2]PSS64464.1 hypothetical protein C6558_13265 [Ensifer sp. NM-2]
MQPKPIAELRLLGGHPVLDYVNTVDSRKDRLGPDALVSFNHLIEWATRLGVIGTADEARLGSKAAAHPQIAEKALEEARALREAIYKIAQAEVRCQAPPKKDLHLIGRMAKRWLAGRTILIRQDGQIAWSESVQDLQDIASKIACLAVDLFTTRDTRRAIKQCPGHNCGWLFLDHSRSGRRHWCSDDICGTYARVKRYRAKGSS